MKTCPKSSSEGPCFQVFLLLGLPCLFMCELLSCGQRIGSRGRGRLRWIPSRCPMSLGSVCRNLLSCFLMALICFPKCLYCGWPVGRLSRPYWMVLSGLFGMGLSFFLEVSPFGPLPRSDYLYLSFVVIASLNGLDLAFSSVAGIRLHCNSQSCKNSIVSLPQTLDAAEKRPKKKKVMPKTIKAIFFDGLQKAIFLQNSKRQVYLTKLQRTNLLNRALKSISSQWSLKKGKSLLRELLRNLCNNKSFATIVCAPNF